MAQTDFEKELEHDFYGNRLLVLLECEAGFRQILLDKTQFKKVSDAMIVEVTEPADTNGFETVQVRLGGILAKEPFEGMRDFYPPEVLAEADEHEEDDEDETD